MDYERDPNNLFRIEDRLRERNAFDGWDDQDPEYYLADPIEEMKTIVKETAHLAQTIKYIRDLYPNMREEAILSLALALGPDYKPQK